MRNSVLAIIIILVLGVTFLYRSNLMAGSNTDSGNHHQTTDENRRP
jgi:hypothetical protein